LIVKVFAGVAGAVVTTGAGPPDEPEPPLVEPVPGPPEGTIRSSSCSSRKTTLRRFSDAGRRFMVALGCFIQPVNRVHSAMTGSFRATGPLLIVTNRRETGHEFPVHAVSDSRRVTYEGAIYPMDLQV
jgi:hypothetical protein